MAFYSTNEVSGDVAREINSFGVDEAVLIRGGSLIRIIR